MCAWRYTSNVPFSFVFQDQGMDVLVVSPMLYAIHECSSLHKAVSMGCKVMLFVIVILHQYEDPCIVGASPGYYRISANVHGKFVLASRDGYPQGINKLTIPCSTHHCTKWDRLPRCVRQPGHTALRRHRQENVVSCMCEVFASKWKITLVASAWRLASTDIHITATFQSSQTPSVPYCNQTCPTLQFTHRLWNQTLQSLLLPEDHCHQLSVGLGHGTGLSTKHTSTHL